MMFFTLKVLDGADGRCPVRRPHASFLCRIKRAFQTVCPYPQFQCFFPVLTKDALFNQNFKNCISDKKRQFESPPNFDRVHALANTVFDRQKSSNQVFPVAKINKRGFWGFRTRVRSVYFMIHQNQLIVESSRRKRHRRGSNLRQTRWIALRIRFNTVLVLNTTIVQTFINIIRPATSSTLEE